MVNSFFKTFEAGVEMISASGFMSASSGIALIRSRDELLKKFFANACLGCGKAYVKVSVQKRGL